MWKNKENLVYRIGYIVLNELKELIGKTNIGAKIVLLDEKSRSILLVRHNYKGKNLWYFPGGTVKNNERPDLAIKRELKEEIGIDLKSDLSLVGVYNSSDNIPGLTFLFYSETDGVFIDDTKSEIEEAKYFKINNIPKNVASGVSERIAEALKHMDNITWKEW